MKSVVLVGGMGTRMRPLTYHTPKQMLPLVGSPIIEYVLGNLGRQGVTDAVLSLGYMPDRFIEAYPDNVIGGVKVSYAVEPEAQGTAGAIRFAAEHAGIDDTFLVVNGDVLTDLDVTRLLEFHRSRHATASISLHAVEDPSLFGVVPTTPDGRVIAFVEKPPRDEAPTNLINAGAYLFEPSVLERIDAGRPVSVERETFPALAAEGSLFALADEGYWLDTGTPATYLRANVDVLEGRNGHHGPALVGLVDATWCHPSARVSPDAHLRRAVVDRDCVVGAGVELDHVVLMPGCVIDDGAVLSHCIVGPRAVIGAAATLEATCVIGAGEFVEPGESLAGDVRRGEG